MLTTTDNPYDPFTQWDEWLAYDIAMGYNTCGYLARIVQSTDDLGENFEEDAIDAAIFEIIRLDLLGIYAVARRENS